jgi:hypothetical protein
MTSARSFLAALIDARDRKALLCAYYDPIAEALLQPVVLTPQCATPFTYIAPR